MPTGRFYHSLVNWLKTVIIFLIFRIRDNHLGALAKTSGVVIISLCQIGLQLRKDYFKRLLLRLPVFCKESPLLLRWACIAPSVLPVEYYFLHGDTGNPCRSTDGHGIFRCFPACIFRYFKKCQPGHRNSPRDIFHPDCRPSYYKCHHLNFLAWTNRHNISRILRSRFRTSPFDCTSWTWDYWKNHSPQNVTWYIISAFSSRSLYLPILPWYSACWTRHCGDKYVTFFLQAINLPKVNFRVKVPPVFLKWPERSQ